MSIMIEFWHSDKQEAECLADEVFSMGAEQQRNFWHVQDLLDRAIKLRMEGSHESE